MTISITPIDGSTASERDAALDAQHAALLKKLGAELTHWFGAEFVVVDGASGAVVNQNDPHLHAASPSWDWWCELARAVRGADGPN